MTNVKRIFFLTVEEVEAQRKETGDKYISAEGPHFELEDGTIIYAKTGHPAARDLWFDVVKIY